MEDPLIRRHTLPTASFVDPAIVRFIEKSPSSSSSSVFLNHIPQQSQEEEEEEEEEENDDDEDSIISSSIASSSFMQHQKLSPPQPTASTSLDHLWSKQEKYDNLELRLFALEESEKRFEHRLQVLEKNKNNILLQQQPMKPDQQGQEIMQQQQQHDSVNAHDSVDDGNYMDLYHSLLEKYNLLQIESKEKEVYYKQRIQELINNQEQQQQEEEEEEEEEEEVKHVEDNKEAYREEDGYLIFDTTSMNGEITHCRVKIPTTQTYYNKQDPSSFFVSPPATRVGSPQYHSPLPSSQQHYHHHHHHHITSPKKGLNPNAPEWKKRSYYQ